MTSNWCLERKGTILRDFPLIICYQLLAASSLQNFRAKAACTSSALIAMTNFCSIKKKYLFGNMRMALPGETASPVLYFQQQLRKAGPLYSNYYNTVTASSDILETTEATETALSQKNPWCISVSYYLLTFWCFLWLCNQIFIKIHSYSLKYLPPPPQLA